VVVLCGFLLFRGAMMSRAMLAAVVIVAVLLRVWFWSWQASSGAVQPGDPEEYYRAALHLLQGGYHDTGKWLRPPLYPAFLATMFAIAGIDVSFALLGQALLTGVGVLAFIVLGSWLFERRAVGLLSAFIAATFVPLASFGSVLFAEALFVVLVVLGLALFDRAQLRRTWPWLLAAGLVFGLATLTRAVALFFLPIGALILIGVRIQNSEFRGLGEKQEVSSEQRAASSENQGTGNLVPETGHPVTLTPGPRVPGSPGPPARSSPNHSGIRPARGLSAAIFQALMFLLGAILVIAPWTLRNYLVHERLILVDTNGGISMWYGTIRSEEDEKAGEAQIFALPNLADRQSLAVQMTIERISADPLWFLGRVRFKVASLFLLQSRSFVTGEVVAISAQDEQVALSAGENPLWLSLIADVQYVLIMLAGIVGLAFVPSWRRALPALALVAVFVGLSALTIGHHRLRLPIVGVMIPFAAYALLLGMQLFLNRRERKGRKGSSIRPAVKSGRLLVAIVGCLVFLALIFSFRYLTWARGEWYALAGRQALAAGDFVAAEAGFQQALARDPSNASRMIELADVAAAQADFALADERYTAALKLEPRNLYSYAMRAMTASLNEQQQIAEESLARIASYGRDNNDIYAWAWQHRVPLSKPPTRLVPGTGIALGHFVGFAPATPDLARGRWTLGKARLRLQGSCGDAVITVRGPEGRLARFVVEESDEAMQILLNGPAQEVRLPLNSIRDCEFAPPVTILIESSTGLLDIETAPWAVGVAVLEARVN
jgi:hypothetical protein